MAERMYSMNKNNFIVSFKFVINGDENLKNEIRDMFHNHYVGCNDYIDSNVVVCDNDSKTELIIVIDDCKKKQLMLDKAVVVINKFLHDPRIKSPSTKERNTVKTENTVNTVNTVNELFDMIFGNKENESNDK